MPAVSVIYVGCFHVAVDRRIPSPLIHEPVADAELKSEFSHFGIVRVKMLVMHHARWNMDCVALRPVVPLAIDL
jgi:hypothetical protein